MKNFLSRSKSVRTLASGQGRAWLQRSNSARPTPDAQYDPDPAAQYAPALDQYAQYAPDQYAQYAQYAPDQYAQYAPALDQYAPAQYDPAPQQYHEIEEDEDEEDHEDAKDEEDHEDALVTMSPRGVTMSRPRPRPNRLLGFIRSAATNFTNQLQRFSTSKGPRIFKLCIVPRPGKPGEWTIHNLCVQTDRDKKYFAASPSTQVYDEEEINKELLASLNKDWANYDPDPKKTSPGFRKQVWDKHGKNSGLTVEEYFTLGLFLYTNVLKAVNFKSFSSSPLASELSHKIHIDLEEKYGHPGANAYPEIVCK